jgi:hypothetical protein
MEPGGMTVNAWAGWTGIVVIAPMHAMIRRSAIIIDIFLGLFSIMRPPFSVYFNKHPNI